MALRAQCTTLLGAIERERLILEPPAFSVFIYLIIIISLSLTLVAGCSGGHVTRPLDVIRWDMGQTNNVVSLWYIRRNGVLS